MPQVLASAPLVFSCILSAREEESWHTPGCGAQQIPFASCHTSSFVFRGDGHIRGVERGASPGCSHTTGISGSRTSHLLMATWLLEGRVLGAGPLGQFRGPKAKLSLGKQNGLVWTETASTVLKQHQLDWKYAKQRSATAVAPFPLPCFISVVPRVWLYEIFFFLNWLGSGPALLPLGCRDFYYWKGPTEVNGQSYLHD